MRQEDHIHMAGLFKAIPELTMAHAHMLLAVPMKALRLTPATPIDPQNLCDLPDRPIGNQDLTGPDVPNEFAVVVYDGVVDGDNALRTVSRGWVLLQPGQPSLVELLGVSEAGGGNPLVSARMHRQGARFAITFSTLQESSSLARLRPSTTTPSFHGRFASQPTTMQARSRPPCRRY